MLVQEKIDWMSVTFDAKTQIPNLILDHDESRLVPIKSPIPVYDRAYEIAPYGAKLLLGSDRLGKHLIMSGKVLDSFREHEIDMVDIWKMIVGQRGKVSRIDLAIDVFDEPRISPNEVRHQHNFGNVTTKLKGDTFIGKGLQTETYYIGKMNSQTRKFRVYNKAVEQGIIDRYWTRIEYEKRRNAHKTAQTVFNSGQSIRSIIKTVVDFPEWELWQEIFSCETATIPRDEKDMPRYVDKMSWIVDTVAPAIANAVKLEQDERGKDFTLDKSQVLDALSYALTRELNKKLNL